MEEIYINTLSLCMIVKNEEDVIGRCLECVSDIFDEIIVVDTGSEDKTRDIVKKYTKNLYYFKWIEDFAAARNYAFSKATKDYIMWLDADDIILDKDKEKITEILEEISDKKALKIANRDKTKQLTLTDEEILTILKFQIKYMISTHQIERIFGISKSNYKKRVKRLQTEHEKLVSDFEYIADFVSCIPNKVTERR